eukprot:jgi/Psemu1/157425/gw1.15.216.1
MGKPTIYQTLRQVVGRAFRETGQALDRAGIKGQQMAVTTRVIGDDPVIYQDHLSRHRQQMPLLRRGKPVVAKNVAFLAPCATLIGSVHIGAGSSVFYKSILRADNCDNAEAFSRSHDDDDDSALALDKGESSGSSSGKDGEPGGGIFVGENTNIQDGCIIDAKTNHTRIGNGVTIGHLASIHSATVHDHCLIGMGSLLQEGVIVCEESFVAAGANIAKGTVVGPGELWVGSPARKVRDLTAEERERLHYQADAYVEVASALKENMLLGGNLPESLSQYMY